MFKLLLLLYKEKIGQFYTEGSKSILIGALTI